MSFFFHKPTPFLGLGLYIDLHGPSSLKSWLHESSGHFQERMFTEPIQLALLESLADTHAACPGQWPPSIEATPVTMRLSGICSAGLPQCQPASVLS